MKKTIATLVFAAWIISGIASCSGEKKKAGAGEPEPSRRFTLHIHSKSSTCGEIEVDSFNMTSKTEAVVWMDGHPNHITADEIVPSKTND